MSNETVYTAPPSPPPADEPASPQPVQPVQPQKTRRVGTFTMGISLVGAGVAAIYSLFDPSLDLATVFRFTPAILILLGLEILVFSIIGKNAKLKYDFLSIVVCMVLLFTAFCVGIIPYAIVYWGPERDFAENRLEGELYDMCYAKLGTTSGVRSLDVSIDLRTQTADKDTSISDLHAGDRIWVDVRLDKEYPTARAFAEDCHSIMAKLKQINVDFDTVAFSARGDIHYDLRLEGRYLQDMTADQLAPLVEVERMTEEDAEIDDTNDINDAVDSEASSEVTSEESESPDISEAPAL